MGKQDKSKSYQLDPTLWMTGLQIFKGKKKLPINVRIWSLNKKYHPNEQVTPGKPIYLEGLIDGHTLKQLPIYTHTPEMNRRLKENALPLLKKMLTGIKKVPTPKQLLDNTIFVHNDPTADPSEFVSVRGVGREKKPLVMVSIYGNKQDPELQAKKILGDIKLSKKEKEEFHDRLEHELVHVIHEGSPKYIDYHQNLKEYRGRVIKLENHINKVMLPLMGKNLLVNDFHRSIMGNELLTSWYFGNRIGYTKDQKYKTLIEKLSLRYRLSNDHISNFLNGELNPETLNFYLQIKLTSALKDFERTPSATTYKQASRWAGFMYFLENGPWTWLDEKTEKSHEDYLTNLHQMEKLGPWPGKRGKFPLQQIHPGGIRKKSQKEIDEELKNLEKQLDKLSKLQENAYARTRAEEDFAESQAYLRNRKFQTRGMPHAIENRVGELMFKKARALKKRLMHPDIRKDPTLVHRELLKCQNPWEVMSKINMLKSKHL